MFLGIRCKLQEWLNNKTAPLVLAYMLGTILITGLIALVVMLCLNSRFSLIAQTLFTYLCLLALLAIPAVNLGHSYMSPPKELPLDMFVSFIVILISTIGFATATLMDSKMIVVASTVVLTIGVMATITVSCLVTYYKSVRNSIKTSS